MNHHVPATPGLTMTYSHDSEVLRPGYSHIMTIRGDELDGGAVVQVSHDATERMLSAKQAPRR